jgi:hypothetical protein
MTDEDRCGSSVAGTTRQHDRRRGRYRDRPAHAQVRFRRAIERRALWLAEDAARELPNLSLQNALHLVHLYAERGSPKYEKAAMRWLERYLTEGSPRLQHLAEITTALAKREH